jgi:hypothetical protein
MSTVEQERDTMYEVAQKFNDRNEYNLDAQPDTRGRVTVYTGSDESLQEVIAFDSASELEDWAYTLDRMDEFAAVDAIEVLVEQSIERQASYWRSIRPCATSSDDLAYEPHDPKRADFLELVGA